MMRTNRFEQGRRKWSARKANVFLRTECREVICNSCEAAVCDVARFRLDKFGDEHVCSSPSTTTRTALIHALQQSASL